MTIALTSPITGTAQTGLTSPTYTIAADSPPDWNAKQWAVTALGGTQTGVSIHSVSSPFTHTFWKPRIMRMVGSPNPVTGVLPANQAPLNSYQLLTRKGVIPLAGQAPRVMLVRTVIEVPAGSETVDAEDVRAALSSHIGALSQVSAGIGDTCTTGLM